MNRIENALLMEIEKLKARVAEIDERLADNIADTVNHYQGLMAAMQARLVALESKQPLNPA